MSGGFSVPADVAETIMALHQGKLTKPCEHCGRPRKAWGMNLAGLLWGQCPSCRFGRFVEYGGQLVWLIEPSAMEAPEGGPFREEKTRL